MEKRPTVNLQAISVKFIQATRNERQKKLQDEPQNKIDTLANLFLRAASELGYRGRAARRPVRVQNAPRRKSIRGITYGK